MSMLSTFLKVLEMPDDQNHDWYAWATNQCGHVLFGVFAALLFPAAAVQMALIAAVLKEGFDIMSVTTARTIRDSVVDTLFWVIGAIVISHHYIGMALFVFGLTIGIIDRMRKAI